MPSIGDDHFPDIDPQLLCSRDEVYMGPVEVITLVARRRRWSPEEKRAMFQEAESPGMSVSWVARNPSPLG
jgi:hypothetical protein